MSNCAIFDADNGHYGVNTTLVGTHRGLDVNLIGGGTSGATFITTAAAALTTKLDYVAGTNPIYVGEAVPGSAVGSSVWRIKKLTYNGAGNVTDIEFAAATGAGPWGLFDQVWDDRATLDYA